MGRIKINKEDKSRVILTELLPYEVPMLFSNEGFYNIISNGNLDYFEDNTRIQLNDTHPVIGILHKYHLSGLLVMPSWVLSNDCL